jgi:hypothetical protein
MAAAAQLLARGATPVVLEAGPAVGANVRAWGHVRLFSPWKYNVDAAARALLEASGWAMPEGDDFPTGRELVERYLAPLAALPTMAPHIRVGTRVLGISRQGVDKMKNAGREQAPFQIHIATPDGEEMLLARAVIDASGAYGTPSPLGANGMPAVGERALRDDVFYGIPDVLGAERARYAGRRVLVVGSGHSAFNALLDLAELAEQAPGTQVIWAIRRSAPGQMFGGGANDLLPARGELGSRVRALVDAGTFRMEQSFRIGKLARTGAGIVASDGERVLPPVDTIIATTGFRPDLAPLSELRLALDPAVESPVQLAPMIDPNFHSCGTVRPHGEAELRHPEPGFYIAGMKSYGRAPTFLMLTGYEQVRSIACALTGDMAGAARVELELPETGVCFTDYEIGSCCGVSQPAAQADIGLVASASCCGPVAAAPVATSSIGVIDLAPVAASANCCGPVAAAAPVAVVASASCCSDDCCSGGTATAGCCDDDCCATEKAPAQQIELAPVAASAGCCG